MFVGLCGGLAVERVCLAGNIPPVWLRLHYGARIPVHSVHGVDGSAAYTWTNEGATVRVVVGPGNALGLAYDLWEGQGLPAERWEGASVLDDEDMVARTRRALVRLSARRG